MAAPRRNYAALKETQQQVDEDRSPALADAQASRPQPAPEPVNETDLLEAHRTAYTEVLQEKARMGLIPGYEVPYRLSRFENGEPIAMGQAQDAARLREAREIAEAAAEREEAERAQELEKDELER